MGVSAYVTDGGTNSQSFSVVGSAELNSLWKPIIERRGLHFLDYIVTACIKIDESNCDEIANELRVLMNELESIVPFEEDIVNPVFRCKRLLDIVTSFHENSKKEIHIG